MRKALISLLFCTAMSAQVAVTPYRNARATFVDPNGLPLASGCVFFYEGGTNTPQNTYTDSTGSTPNPNPVILDSTGSANIWLGPETYKIAAWSYGGTNCSTGVQQWVVDNVPGNYFLNGTINGATITNSTINSTTIGASVPSTGVFTTLTATTINGTLNGNASTATSLDGGSLGSIPYQSAANTTAMLTGNTAATDEVLVSHGTGSAANAPTLTNSPAISGSNITSLPSSSGAYPALCTGTQFSQGLSPGSNNCASPSSTIGQIHVTTVTASGTFTIPSGTSTSTQFEIFIVGGGGSGGGGSSGVSGSGGGAGAMAHVLESGWTAGNTITVTIGAGGVGSAGATGTAGGSSSIASGTQTITTVTAGGGGAGIGGDTPNANYGGPGGTPTNGDALSTNGGDGGTGNSFSSSNGASGGASYFGGGGRGFYGGTTGNGSNGEAYGSGGGGGSSNSSAAGGNGAPGVVEIRWIQ